MVVVGNGLVVRRGNRHIGSKSKAVSLNTTNQHLQRRELSHIIRKAGTPFLLDSITSYSWVIERRSRRPSALEKSHEG